MTSPQPDEALEPSDPDVERALADLEEADPLRAVEFFRARLDPARARAAARLHALRRRARERLGEHPPPWLTAKGLEQASAAAVAGERARRVAAMRPRSSILDATSGIGSDALALSRAGLFVVAADADLLLARCSEANLRAAGLPARVLVARAEEPAARTELVFIDPDRRAGGGRSLDPSLWSPTLEKALASAARFRGAVLKLAPALDPALLEGAARSLRAARPCWISRGGELAELSLWTGCLADAVLGPREALALDERGGSASLAGEPLRVEPLPESALRPEGAHALGFLVEPDPAVIRSGLVGLLAHRLGLVPLAPKIAYLVGPRPEPSLLWRAWPVVDIERADPRRVRAMLARHDVGRVVVKKRGHPLPADELARRFAGRGEREGLLAVARTERGHVALLLGENAAGPERATGVGDEGFEPPTSSL